MIRLLIFAVLPYSGSVNAQVNTPLAISWEKVINLGEVKDQNEDFIDFEKLEPIPEGVEVLMLGEQSHGEGIPNTKYPLLPTIYKLRSLTRLISIPNTISIPLQQLNTEY